MSLRCWILGHKWTRIGTSEKAPPFEESNIFRKVVFYFICIDCSCNKNKTINLVDEIKPEFNEE